jgi:hypothetical protein
MNTAWTTNNELKFVQHLATIKPASQRRPLLEGYLAGFRRRMNWEGIDPKEVLEATEEALEFLQ